jgi:hypothetical protein
VTRSSPRTPATTWTPWLALAFIREVAYAAIAIRWGDHLVMSGGEIGAERVVMVLTFAGLAAGTGADRLRALKGKVFASANGVDAGSSTEAATP